MPHGIPSSMVMRYVYAVLAICDLHCGLLMLYVVWIAIYVMLVDFHILFIFYL